MSRLAVCRWGLILLTLFALHESPVASYAQANGPTFSTPLAVIGGDGNVYLLPAGASQGTALTSDANFNLSQTTTRPAHEYTHLRWSPDGKNLAFEDSITHTLFDAPLGASPKALALNVADGYPPVWQPDSSVIVYAANGQQNGMALTINLLQVAPDGSQSKMDGSFTENVGCGGGGLDAAGTLYDIETGLGGNAPTLAWTPHGWLYTTTCNGIGLALLGANNQVVWHDDTLGRVAISASGAHAVAVQFDQQGNPTALVNLDLASGNSSPISGISSVEQVAWSADESTIFYSTSGNQQVGLWSVPAQGGQPTSLFADQGAYIGAIASSPDSKSVLFSYIPTGSNPQTRLLMVPASGSTANLNNATTVAPAGQPAFAIVAASALPSATATPCTLRADWQNTYTVVSGDTLFSIAQRAGTTAAVLAAGNCLANANAIFAGQVLRVPVAVSPPAIAGGKRITFPTGATSVAVQGQVAANGIDRWVLTALAGQTMSAQLAFAAGQAILVVYGADGNVLQSDHAGASSFNGVLPSTQDYVLDVRGVASGPASYTLTITIPPLTTLPPNAKRISFPPGATTVTVQGQAPANGIDRWVLQALGGQTLSAQLSTTQAILIVYGVDGTVLQTDHVGASAFGGVLPSTQDYILDVRNVTGNALNYALTITIPPLVSPPTSAKRIVFPSGATSVNVQGQVAANNIDRWVLKALAGQTLSAQLSTAQAILIVYGADGTVLQTDHVGASTFSGVLPSTQDYIIDVRNVTGSTLNYTLTITVPPLMMLPPSDKGI